MNSEISLSMLSRHLVIWRNGTPIARLSFRHETGFTLLHKLKSDLLTLAGESIFRKRVFPRDVAGRTEVVRPLAQAGWKLLDALFDEPERKELLELLAGLQDGSCVEVRFGGLDGRQHLWLPLNLMYGSPTWEDADVSKFLGAKNVFAEVLDEDEHAGVFAESLGLRVSAEGAEGFGFVDDDLLFELGVQRSDVERKSLESLFQERFKPLMPPLSPDKYTAEFERYARYVARTWIALHFGAHAVMKDGEPKRYSMRVSSGFHHSVELLAARAERMGGLSNLPFTFFNSCHSAMEGMAGEFAACGHFNIRGVKATVGTSAEVCNSLAEDFAHLFYELALSEKRTVGEAFLEAQRTLLAETGNPSVLVYQFLGNVDQCLWT